MSILLQKSSKLVCLAMTLIMVFGIFLSASVSAYAAIDNNPTKQPLTSNEQLIFAEEFENDFNFIMQQAVTYDYMGNVKSLNFELLYEKFGKTSELTRLEEQVNKDTKQKRFRRASAQRCAINAIQDTLGVSAIDGLISGGIVGLLQKKAAAEVAKLVAKYAFKGLLPGVAAASLIWSFGRCMWF